MFADVVICPECHKHLKVRGSLPTEKRVPCPACGRRILPIVADNPIPVAMPVRPPVSANPWKVVQLALAAAILFVGIGLGGMMFRATGSERASVPVASRNDDRAALVSPAPAPSPIAAGYANSVESARKPDPPPVPPPVVVAAPVAPVVPAAPVAPVVAVAPVAPPGPLPQIGLPNVPQIITNPQVGYTYLMNQASVAMLDGRYDDARSLYSEALQIAPNLDPAPSLAANCPPPIPNRLDCLRNVRRNAWAPSPPPVVSPNQGALDGIRQAAYRNGMANGDVAMRAKNYSAAISDFQAALRSRPSDPVAAFALVQAQGQSL